jgi:hypothetical protein
MSGPPVKRRRTKAIGPDSDVFAKAYTYKTVTTINRSGIPVTKDIRVPLVPIIHPENNEASSSTTRISSNYHDVTMETMEEPVSNDIDINMSSHNTSKVS